MGCASSVPVAPPRVQDDIGDGAVSSKDKASSAMPQPDTPTGDTIKVGVVTASPASSMADEKAKEAKDKAKSKTARARRLSYVQNTEGQIAERAGSQGQTPQLLPQEALAVAPSPTVPASSKNKTTRARRLSYVSNDPSAEPNKGGPPSAVEVGPASDPNQVTPSLAVPGPAQILPPVSGSVQCTMACMSRAGREPGFKKQNQDNCFAFEKFISGEQSLYGAFDGHGPNGHLVSGYVKQHLPIMLVNHLSMEPDLKKALTNGFLEVDKAMQSSRIDCEFSGSTAVVGFLRGRTLATAWVGDSRCVMGKQAIKGGPFEAVDMTRDHKPTLPEEKARIQAANGRVERLVDEAGEPIGPFRVWLQYAWIPGLAMSRALGDLLAHSVGVTSEPECTIVDLTPSDKFIILASDGVWEFISSQEAVDIVGNCTTVEEGCRQLVDEAHQRWLVEEEGVVDDITAVVVRFNTVTV